MSFRRANDFPKRTARQQYLAASMLLLLALTSFQAMADESGLILRSNCIANQCIEMVLNWGSARPEFTTSNVSSSGHTVFTFNIEGKLNGGETTDHEVSFTGYTDGIECSDFGQGVVAVLGMNDGKPILETSKGSLEVMDQSMSVGCADCLQIVDAETGQVVKKYHAPAWDLTLANIDSAAERFSYDADNRLFFKKNDGACLMLTNRGLIEDYDLNNCKELTEIKVSGARSVAGRNMFSIHI